MTQAPARGARGPAAAPRAPRAVAVPPEPRLTVELAPLGARLREEWEELARRTAASPFLRPGYLEAWTEGFGEPVGTRALVARAGGRLEALTCLVAAGGRLRSVGNEETPDAGILASGPEARAAVGRGLVAQGAHRVTIGPLAGGDASHLAFVAAADAAGHRVLTRSVMRCPVVSTSGGWDAYWRGRSRNTRHKVERLLRRLDEAGRADFRMHAGDADLDALLDEAFRVEASGWKGDAGSAIASRPESRRYYAALARWAAGRGWLRLGFLRLDGRPLAFGYGIEAGGVHSLLKIGFDPVFGRLSPGTLLLHRMIRHAFESGCSVFDFAGKAEPYKLTWATGVVEHVEVAAFRPSPRGRVELAAARGRRALAASPAGPRLRRARAALRSRSHRHRPGARVGAPAGRERTAGAGGQ